MTTRNTLVKDFRTESNVYIIEENNEACHISKIEESWLCNRILRHINFDHVIKLRKREVVRDFPTIKNPPNTMCKSCQLGKQTRTTFKSKDQLSTSKPLELVHMDLCEPSRTNAPGGESYFMLIIDDFSRLTWVEFLRYKPEAFEKFKIIKALLENQTGCKLKFIKPDRGGEFTDDDFVDL